MNTPHPTQTARRAWVRRAAVAGSMGVGSGFVAHVAMGGAVPGLAGVVPALVLSTVVGLALLTRPGVVRTLVATLVSQWLFHTLAVLGSAPATSGHVHGAVEPLVALAGAEASMTLGHIGAAFVTTGFVVGAFRVRTLYRRVSFLVGQWVSWPRELHPVVVATVPHSAIRPLSVPIFFSSRIHSGAGVVRGPPAAFSH